MAATEPTQASAPAAGPSYFANPAELPSGTLVQAFFAAVAHDKAEAHYRYSPEGWQAISHAEVYRNVKLLATAMRGLGVVRGDRIALLAENRPEWPLADYAAICIGALTVPVYPTLSAQQVGYILRHSGARLAFVSSAEQLAKVQEARAYAPSVQQIVVFDEAAADGDVLSLRQLLERAAAAEPDDAAFRAEALQASPDDVATLIYTSGTTGEPKGVMLTHNNIFSNVEAALAEVLTVTAKDVSLSFLPLSHVLQRMVDYALFYAGVSIAYVPTIELVPQAMREIRPTIAVSVPRVYEKLYARILNATGVKRMLVVWARQVALDWTDAVFGDGPGAALKLQHRIADKLVFSKIRKGFGDRINFFVSGGAPLSPVVAKFFYGAGVLILEGYGLTETSPVTNVNTAKRIQIGSVGRPIPGTEIQIAEDGEILVRGPQVMKGYYDNEEATTAVIEPDGWFHTGDIGALDAMGFLRITDRKKDILVTAGGKNIAPQPIQNAAKTSRFVSDALLIGDRRPYPVLLVVPNFESLKTWAKLHEVSGEVEELVRNPRVCDRVQQDVELRLADFARYERPKKVLLLGREFSQDRGEITPTLKVKRRVVEDHFSKEIEALYAEPAGDAAEPVAWAANAS